jgi:Na+/H+ antiporter NhaA
MAVVDPSEIPIGTAWLQRNTALRRFLQTETASAALLLGAAVAPLIWANIDSSSYDRVWQTPLSIHLGQAWICAAGSTAGS